MNTIDPVIRSGGTAAAAALLSCLTFSPAPTVNASHGSSAPMRIPLSATTPYSTQNEKRFGGGSISRASSTASAVYAMYEPVFAKERKTSEAELIAGTFREWEHFSTNWDGEGGLPPLRQSLENAANFIYSLAIVHPSSVTDAEPMLHPSGNAGLFWDKSNLYADLEFLSDNKMAYFVERGMDRHKGLVHYDGKAVPAAIRTLLEG
jgi:hypothetical protein